METQTSIKPAAEVKVPTTVKKVANKPAVKAVVKAAPKGTAKVATKVTGIATKNKEAIAKATSKATSSVAKSITEVKKDAVKVAKNVKASVDVSTVDKVIETGKATSKIFVTAGGKLLNNSIKSTKAIATIYTKVGKKALTLGKDLINETSKVIYDNQKVMRDTSMKAFKETVETIQDSHLIEFPFKKK